MKKRVALSLILLLSLLLSSCAEVSENRALVLLYDYSESVAPKLEKTSAEAVDLRADYLPTSREIISHSGPGTTIQGALINSNSLQVTKAPINGDFPRFRPLWDNQIRFNSDLLKKKLDVLQQIERAISGKGASGSTCIIDSMLLARQFFGSNKAAHKVLVIFSDMIEDCDSIDFDKTPRAKARGLPRNEAEINNLIKELQRAQKLPDLRGVQVCIYRAAGGQIQDDSSSRLIAIESFWRAFFASAGAEVINYGTFVRYPFGSESAANVELPRDSLATSPVPAH